MHTPFRNKDQQRRKEEKHLLSDVMSKLIDDLPQPVRIIVIKRSP
ncbi:hypothetical protein ABZ519_24075 [Streptomyces collinus]